MRQLIDRTCAALTLFAAAHIPLQAQGPNDLLVVPPRVVFEGATRSVSVSLINTSNDTNSYVVTMQNYRMTAQGELQLITTPDSGQLFADGIVRYFPRQVTLAPKEEQILRLQLVGGSDLASGEYRSHIYLRAIPRARTAETLSDTSAARGISMRLTPIYGIIVPVIVRHGDVTVAVDIPDVKLDTSNHERPRLNVNLHRWGTASTYGDIAVEYRMPGADPIAIGRINGVAVYPPNPLRTVQVPLNIPDGIRLSGGTLSVVYNSRSNYRESTMAQAELTLP